MRVCINAMESVNKSKINFLTNSIAFFLQFWLNNGNETWTKNSMAVLCSISLKCTISIRESVSVYAYSTIESDRARCTSTECITTIEKKIKNTQTNGMCRYRKWQHQQQLRIIERVVDWPCMCTIATWQLWIENTIEARPYGKIQCICKKRSQIDTCGAEEEEQRVKGRGLYMYCIQTEQKQSSILTHTIVFDSLSRS